jgi:hypothetical protein
MRSIIAKLTSASRSQDHTTSPSASQRIRLVHCKRPSLPAPNVRDDRETPLVRSAGCAEDAADLLKCATLRACGALARRANHLQMTWLPHNACQGPDRDLLLPPPCGVRGERSSLSRSASESEPGWGFSRIILDIGPQQRQWPPPDRRSATATLPTRSVGEG